MSFEDKMFFAKKDNASKESSKKRWKILIVDDEPEVHSVTQMILGKEQFENRKFEFISAYSAKETKEIMSKESDMAVILLDVVMENDTAGLEATEYIREVLENQAVRIILRTGQPGEAPDKSVIVDYDINDYKEKSELTSNKLFTAVIAAIRSYSQFISVDRCRSKLKSIVQASAGYCKSQDVREFSQELLDRIDELLRLGKDSLYINFKENRFDILASRGSFSSVRVDKFSEFTHKGLVDSVLSMKKSITVEEINVLYYESEILGQNLIVVSSEEDAEKSDFDLLEIFINNSMSAFSNLLSNRN